jgi:hypothetical protein
MRTAFLRKNMKKITLLMLTICLANIAFAQQKKPAQDTTKIHRITYSTVDDLRKKQAQAGIETLTYQDYTFNFKVKVPNWLHLQETGSVYFFGGTLPAVKGIENAIMIKSYDKAKFESFKIFRKFVAEDLVYGQSPAWSKAHKSMGGKPLGKYRKLGYAYKQYFLLEGLVYHCQYVLVETKTAYLWIDYTATDETFDVNLPKFEEFMDGFELTKFKKK